MAITCQIRLFKHPDSTYAPGNSVRGTVNYLLHEETKFKRITVSLKGLGSLHVSKTVQTGKTTTTQNYNNKETYVDIDYVVHDDAKGISTQAGSYEVPFSFVLPQNIPCSFKYKGSLHGASVTCKISYYIRIKFERPGLFSFDKRFKTKINVSSMATPTLPSWPVSYVCVKKPFQLFWGKNRVINIHGTVENSVTTPGGHVKISYKVENGTKLDIRDVEINLSQEITFKCNGYFGNLTDYMKLNSCKATPVKAGDSQTLELILDIPPNVSTMQYSVLVSRNYFIEIIADLPLPHRNAVFKIPIEVIDNPSDEAVNIDYDSPPSYNDVMQEFEKEDLD